MCYYNFLIESSFEEYFVKCIHHLYITGYYIVTSQNIDALIHYIKVLFWSFSYAIKILRL